MLCGWVDGVDMASRTTLKIVTRGHLTFGNGVAPIEVLQQIALMRICGCKQCLFVENGPDGQIAQTVIEYDEQVFQTQVFEKLESWARFSILGSFRSIKIENY